MKKGMQIALGSVGCAILFAGTGMAARQPNVIVVMTDDQGYGDLACHGHPFVKTPNLDRLHEQSVRLTNFHVSPSCSPTRAAMLTGAYAFRSGMTHVGLGQAMLSRDAYTLAQCFQDNGYRTGLFGKWHLGSSYPQRPQDKGFQECLNWWGAHPGQAPDYWQNNSRTDPWLLHNGTWKKREGFVDDITFADAMEWIDRKKDQPFFLFLPASSAHGPFEGCPDEYEKPYRELGLEGGAPGFYGMITLIDENIGELRAFLKKRGLAEDTILIFLTDNGSDGAVRFGQYNAGMKGGKNKMEEGGTRVPCFVSWPGHLPAGKDVAQVSAHYDIFSTLAELCGLQVPEDIPQDGMSLVPWLREPARPLQPRSLCMNWGWLGPRYIDPDPLKYGKCAVRSQSYRLMNGTHLYNLDEDAGQKHNIADQHPELVQSMRAEYERWWQDVRTHLLKPSFIVIGSEKENPARLTFWDWQPSTVSSEYGGLLAGNPSYKNVPQSVQSWLVSGDAKRLAAPPYMGSWAVETARAGRYRVTLHVLAPEAQEPARLKAGTAHVRCGEQQTAVEIKGGSGAVSVDIDLKKGEAYLECWFDGQLPENRPCGAFYVEVEYLGPKGSGEYSEQKGTWPGFQPTVLLRPGKVIRAGEVAVSAFGASFCILQKDGKLVVYKGSGPSDNRGYLWGSGGSHPRGDCFATLTDNGHLEIYSGTPESTGGLIWSSATAKGLSRGDYLNAPGVALPDALYDQPENPDYKVVLWDDGNLWSFSGDIDHHTGIKWSLR